MFTNRTANAGRTASGACRPTTGGRPKAVTARAATSLSACSQRALAALVSLGLTAPLLAVSTVGIASAQTASYAVQVGYYDSLRPNPTQLPTPWPDAGATAVPGLANVYTEGSLVYYGCDPSTCVYDGGAVRIINTSTGALSLQSVAVSFDTYNSTSQTYTPFCTYNIWTEISSSNFPAIPVGGSLILTGTASGGSNGCTPSTGYMDSSDIGGSNNPPTTPPYAYAGQCAANDNEYPVVTVTPQGGQPNPIPDTRQILNTGGVDFASCSGGGTYSYNEGLSWINIGTGGGMCGTDKITIAPSKQTLAIGAQATITADVTNACGQSVGSGVNVLFSFINSADQLSPIVVTTDATGAAQLPYFYQALAQHPTGGIDNIQASVTTGGGVFYSNTAKITWEQSGTAVANVALTGTPLGQGADVTYTATVTGNSGTPQGNVTFNDSVNMPKTVPLLNGAAQWSFPESAGNTYTVTATYNDPSGTYKNTPPAQLTVTGGSTSTGQNSGVSVVAAGGSGTLTEGQYGNSPVQQGLTDGNDYFDISVSSSSTFTTAVITDCNSGNTGITNASGMDWYDKTAGKWEPVHGRPGPIYSEGPPACLTVTLNNKTGTQASSPTINELNGTVFGAKTGDAITSPTGTVVRSGQPVNFTVTTTGISKPEIVETVALPSGLSFKDNGNGTATLSGTAPTVSSNTTYDLVFTAVWPSGKSVLQDFPLTDTTG